MGHVLVTQSGEYHDFLVVAGRGTEENPGEGKNWVQLLAAIAEPVPISQVGVHLAAEVVEEEEEVVGVVVTDNADQGPAVVDEHVAAPIALFLFLFGIDFEIPSPGLYPYLSHGLCLSPDCPFLSSYGCDLFPSGSAPFL